MAMRRFSSKHSLISLIEKYSQGKVPTLSQWDIWIRDHQFYKVEWVDKQDAFHIRSEADVTFKELARRNQVFDFYFEQLIEKHPRFHISIMFDEHGVIQLNENSCIDGEMLCNEEGSFDQAIMYIQEKIPEVLKQSECGITIQNGNSVAESWKKKIKYTYYFCRENSYGTIPSEIRERNFNILVTLNVDPNPNRLFQVIKHPDGSVSTLAFFNKISIINPDHPDELKKRENKGGKNSKKGRVW